MDKELTNINEEQLYSDVSELIEVTRQRALHEINRAGILLYWHIGRRINHDILKNNRAGYGSSVVKKLADKLQIKFGKGFGLRVIQRCMQFERFFSNEEIVASLTQHLKWTHFVLLLNIDSQLIKRVLCRNVSY